MNFLLVTLNLLPDLLIDASQFSYKEKWRIIILCSASVLHSGSINLFNHVFLKQNSSSLFNFSSYKAMLLSSLSTFSLFPTRSFGKAVLHCSYIALRHFCLFIWLPYSLLSPLDICLQGKGWSMKSLVLESPGRQSYISISAMMSMADQV